MSETLATAYAAEICPIKLRGYLASLASLGWGGVSDPTRKSRNLAISQSRDLTLTSRAVSSQREF